MCGSLLKFLIPFNIVATAVAFVAGQGNVETAAVFAGVVWATTLASVVGLNMTARNMIGKSAGC